MQKTDRSDVHLYGWDSNAEFWHGPTPLTFGGRGFRSAAKKLAGARESFHGKLACSVPGLPSMEFPTTVYDLVDIGLAMVHVEGAPGGPAGVVAVIPAARRKQLRPEFAFEFVTFLSFLGGPAKDGADLAIHDYIDEILRTPSSCTQVFTLEKADLDADVSIVLSAHFEHLSAAMVDWLAGRNPEQAKPQAAAKAFAAA